MFLVSAEIEELGDARCEGLGSRRQRRTILSFPDAKARASSSFLGHDIPFSKDTCKQERKSFWSNTAPKLHSGHSGPLKSESVRLLPEVTRTWHESSDERVMHQVMDSSCVDRRLPPLTDAIDCN
ncbi:hypothetical protein WN944_018241 [Citrus x changshan-huyou]|uniref:Uncharacterized protein n=1 Tax=Citrus x changshan-huyou TaxID=2935761 RepID=A0AAP0LVX2_9ROSI